jgi:hypothetical protein
MGAMPTRPGPFWLRILGLPGLLRLPGLIGLPGLLGLSGFLGACGDGEAPPAADPAVAISRSEGATPAPGTTSAPEGPAIRVEPPLHDFGIVYLGEKVSTTFELWNDGDAEVEIEDLASSCGCAVGEIRSRRIPPGGRVALDVAFDSTGFPGPQSKSIRVTTGEPGRSVVVLPFRAVVVPLYRPWPQMLDFGSVYADEEPRQSLVLTFAESPPPEFLGVEVPDPCVEVSVREAPDAAEPALEVEVELRRCGPPGLFDRVVELRFDHPRVPVAAVPIRARILAPIEIEPRSRLDFGSIPAGRTTVRAVELRSRDPDFALELGEVTATLADSVLAESGDDVTIETSTETVEEGRAFRVQVAVTPARPFSHFLGKLEIRTNSPDLPRVILRLQGRVEKP